MSTLAAPPQSARTADQARRLLVGRDAPFSPEEGAAAIRALADQGDADALSALATMRAAGAWTEHNWPEAMDTLQLAAELGSVEARSELLVLSPDRELSARVRSGALRDAGRWRALRTASTFRPGSFRRSRSRCATARVSGRSSSSQRPSYANGWSRAAASGSSRR